MVNDGSKLMQGLSALGAFCIKGGDLTFVAP